MERVICGEIQWSIGVIISLNVYALANELTFEGLRPAVNNGDEGERGNVSKERACNYLKLLEKACQYLRPLKKNTEKCANRHKQEIYIP